MSVNQDRNERSSCTACRNVITQISEQPLGGIYRTRGHKLRLSEIQSGVAQGCIDCTVIASVANVFHLDTSDWVSILEDEWNVINISAPISKELGKIHLYRAEKKDDTVILPVPKWRNLPQARPISNNTSSHEAYGTLKKWLITCSSDHEGCIKGKTEPSLPRRVLEVSASHVYLRECHNLQGKYVCLSHCWGSGGAALQLNDATIAMLRDGVPKLQLPKTFRDATQICTMIGIPYLWIDAICIKQDSPDDWLEAAASMAEIYENAFLTVAATWSHDSNGGCFAQIRERYALHDLGSTGLCARTILPPFPVVNMFSGAADDDWPLLRRGWVFQERYLSTRVIHYARDQLFWECKSSFLSECGTADRDDNTLRGYSLNPLKLAFLGDPHSWRWVIENYSSLKFTKEGDLLPALAGIAKHYMGLRNGDTYVAGMWKNSVLEDVCFYNEIGRRPNGKAPTWSWASLDGDVRFPSYAKLSTLELTGFEYTYDGPSNVGQVINARIRLKGSILQAVCAQVKSYIVIQISGQLPPEARLSLSFKGACHDIASGRQFTIMLVSEPRGVHWALSYGIVLFEVRQGVFERAGAVSLKYFTNDENKCDDIEAAAKSYIDSLPVEEVEII